MELISEIQDVEKKLTDIEEIMAIIHQLAIDASRENIAYRNKIKEILKINLEILAKIRDLRELIEAQKTKIESLAEK